MKLFPRKKPFSSKEYWEQRYNSGGNSGTGSYHLLAEFKAEYINKLILDEDVADAIEFGVGDGNQLSLIHYPRYLGLDVSATAIRNCTDKFREDHSKSFMLYDESAFEDPASLPRADLSISLDVLFHLTEDAVYQKYLHDLFSAGKRLVLIYSTNETTKLYTRHEKNRKFTPDISTLFPQWNLVDETANRYPVAAFGDEKGSDASFFLYKKL